MDIRLAADALFVGGCLIVAVNEWTFARYRRRAVDEALTTLRSARAKLDAAFREAMPLLDELGAVVDVGRGMIESLEDRAAPHGK